MGHARRSRTREGAAAPTALLVRSRGLKTRDKTQRAGSGFSRNREEETTEATRAEHELALGLATKITNLLLVCTTKFEYTEDAGTRASIRQRFHRRPKPPVDLAVFRSPSTRGQPPAVSPSRVNDNHCAGPGPDAGLVGRRRRAHRGWRIAGPAGWGHEMRPQPPGCARTEREPRGAGWAGAPPCCGTGRWLRVRRRRRSRGPTSWTRGGSAGGG